MEHRRGKRRSTQQSRKNGHATRTPRRRRDSAGKRDRNGVSERSGRSRVPRSTPGVRGCRRRVARCPLTGARGISMSIKSDKWIRRMASGHKMIEPFEGGQVRQANGHRVVSYGTSSYGYDIRVSDEFKIFTNINSTMVDPKKFDEKNFVDFRGEVCIIPPNSFALARTVEYFRIPRNVLVLCLGKSTYARCFAANTRVALVDGTSLTLENMARRADSGELFRGYSVGENGRIIVSLLHAPRYIGRDSLCEIELDNGEAVCATPDHDFMLRDGRMLAAAALRPGQSLMPLYRQLVGGCDTVHQPASGHHAAHAARNQK